jgi:hypothetical protein
MIKKNIQKQDFLLYLIRKNCMKRISVTLLKGEATLDRRQIHK